MLTDEQLNALMGVKVKLEPNRGDRKKGGLTIATLIKIDGNSAIVVPSSHKSQEKVPKECIRFWRKGLGLNPNKFKQYSSLFNLDKAKTFDSSGDEEIDMKESLQSNGKRSKGIKYVVMSRAHQLFWCGRHGGFSYNIDDVLVYDNKVGPGVALQLIGKPKTEEAYPRWEHLFKNTNPVELEIVTYDEALELSRKWNSYERITTFTEEALKNPYHYKYGDFTSSEESVSIKKEESVSIKKEESLTEEILSVITDDSPVSVPMPVVSPIPNSPVSVTTSIPDLQKEIAIALKKYEGARKQLADMLNLVEEARQELHFIESELDILKKKKELSCE